MQATTLQKIKAYMQSIRPFFINGSIRLVAENSILKVHYKSAYVDFNVKEWIPLDDKEAFDTVTRFCFNAYTDYERDGQTLTSAQIGLLLGTSSENVRQMLSKIYKKIRLHGEQFLQEEQETGVIYHREQESARSGVQEEQSTGDSGKTQKRVEGPLR